MHNSQHRGPGRGCLCDGIEISFMAVAVQKSEDDSTRHMNEGYGMRSSRVWLFCVYDVRVVSYLDQNHAATRAERASRRLTRPRHLTSLGDGISAFAHGATRETAAHGLQTTVTDRVKRCPDRPRSGTDGTCSEGSAPLAWKAVATVSSPLLLEQY